MDRFFQPLKEIADKYNSLQSALAGAERLVPLLEEEDRHMADEIPDEFKHIESIRFDHVWFSYENNDIYALEDFTLNIKAGEFIGIVGPSGSGKSTLLALLMGVYKPTKGTIYINGINIANYDSSVLRHLMGYVFQQAYLFTEKQIQASIENIRGSKTIVSIAHRLSTVEDANKIVYMEYGKIIEKGSFNELINLKGAFYNLWNNQHSGS